jgi:hypothetical protein
VVLPTRLLPVFVFVLTVGVSFLTTVGAHLRYAGGDSFDATLRRAGLVVAGLYLVGVAVAVVWLLAGGGALWGVATALVATGLVALVALVALPLSVGRRLIQRVRDVDSETALRFTADGWPVATLVVFGIFVAPGGVGRGTVFDLGGAQVCLVGFCGISAPLAGSVTLAAGVAVFGPDVVGFAFHAATSTRDRRLRS